MGLPRLITRPHFRVVVRWAVNLYDQPTCWACEVGKERADRHLATERHPNATVAQTLPKQRLGAWHLGTLRTRKFAYG